MGGGIVTALVLAIWMMWPASPAPSAAVPAAPVRGAATDDQARRDRSGGAREARRVDGHAPGTEREGTKPVSVSAESGAAAAAQPVAMPAPECRKRRSSRRCATGPPPLPPIPLKFIGILERANGEKWAVLSDGKVTMHGRDGDIVDGRYRIVKIGAESIELTYADGKGRQVVRLTGQ